MAELLLIRHGQASLFDADYDKLTERGFAQSVALGGALASRGVVADAVFAGQMRRHAETAASCLREMGHTASPATRRAFDEYDHVEVIRRHEPRYAAHDVMLAELRESTDPRRAFATMFRAAVLRWVGGANDEDYAESWDAFNARVRAGLDEAFAALPPEGMGLVFTSGGTIAASIRSVLGLAVETTLDVMGATMNASITRIRERDGHRVLMGFNDVGHLEPDGLLSFV